MVRQGNSDNRLGAGEAQDVVSSRWRGEDKLLQSGLPDPLWLHRGLGHEGDPTRQSGFCRRPSCRSTGR